MEIYHVGILPVERTGNPAGFHASKRALGRRINHAEGEEIVQDQLNFNDWECDRVAQKWLRFPSGLDVWEY